MSFARSPQQDSTELGGRIQRAAALALAVCALALVHSVSIQAAGGRDAGIQLQGDPATGKPLYDRHCAACHGPKGAGDGQEGRAFDPGPSDFTAIDPDAERFYLATRDGGMAIGLSGAMPAYRYTLSDEDIRHVVTYLIRLAR